MKINQIKEALAIMAAKVEPMAVPSAPQPKSETELITTVTLGKKPKTTKSTCTHSTIDEPIQQKDSASVKPAASVTPKPETANVKISAPESSVPVVKSETKPALRTRKSATSRKTKAAPVVPIDGIEAVVAKYLKPGLDYDIIPGCGRKPTLLKAGAENLAAIYGFRTTSRVINRIERYDQLFVLYEVQTTIYDVDDNIIAEGLGSCNSKERRYQKGDFAANLNTVLKMAKKRSYVDAVLSATCSSGIFTQDIDEILADTRMEIVG